MLLFLPEAKITDNGANLGMSWHKITLPLITDDIDPKVVEIGNLAKDVYARENKPKGFGMFHATRGSKGGHEDKFLVYLTPVASELCKEIIAEKYTVEPCDTPARDEPDVAFVFGDPLTMSMLKDKFEPEPGTVEWERAEEYKAQMARLQADFEAAQAAAAAAAAQAEPGQAEETRAESAQS